MNRRSLKINTILVLPLLLAIFYLFNPIPVFAYTSYSDCVAKKTVEDEFMVLKDPTWVKKMIEPSCKNEFPDPTIKDAKTLQECLDAVSRLPAAQQAIATEGCKTDFPSSGGGSGGTAQTRLACAYTPGANLRDCYCDTTWTAEPPYSTYPGGSCNTGGGGGGSSGGGGGGGGGSGGGGGVPANASCNPQAHALNTLNISTGPLFAKGDKDTFLLPSMRDLSGWGVPVIEAGTLTAFTVTQQIPLLKAICSAVSSLSADIKRIATATEQLVKDNAEVIKPMLIGIKKDTGDLVNKEYVLDPAAWDAKVAAINTEKVKFKKAMEGARPQGIKLDTTSPPGRTVNPQVYTQPLPNPGPEVSDSFTPDINIYEAKSRQNAAELFYGELATYFNQPENKSPFEDFIMTRIARKADDEYNTTSKKFDYIKQLNNDAAIVGYVESLYDEIVDKAGTNAVAEYIAGNTIIGGKTCASIDLVLTSTKNPAYIESPPGVPNAVPKFINTLTCKRDKVLINTFASAPVIKNLLEKFGTTDLTQAEMADERGETAKISGITDVITSAVVPKTSTLTSTPTPKPATTPAPAPVPTPTPAPVATNNTTNTSSSNLASIGILTKTMINKTSLDISAKTNTTPTGKESLITLSVDSPVKPTSCIATSDWLTFINTDKYSTITESSLFTVGDIIPAPSLGNPQTFTVNHPRLFKLSADITEPEVTSVHRQPPSNQVTIQNVITRNSIGLIQKTTYTPNLVGAQVGDNMKLSINDTTVSFGLTNLNPIDLVRRIITEATAGRSDIKTALSNYNFSQDGNILIVATKNPTPTTISSTVTYSLECNINNKAVSSSVNITLP